MNIEETARTRWNIYVRMANAKLRNSATAEDLVQDAFVLALERPDVRDYAAYVCAVVRHLALFGRRKRAVSLPDDIEAGGNPEASLEVKEQVLEYVAACERGSMSVFRRLEERGTPENKCGYCGIGWLPANSAACNDLTCRRKYNRDRARKLRSSGGEAEKAHRRKLHREYERMRRRKHAGL